MRPSALPLLLSLVPMAVASENAWPRKGDTVYISASYKGLSAASPVADAQMKYDLPPCMKLELVKSKPKTLKWVTKDPIGGSEKLEGAWLSHTHQTKAECESQVSSDGEPTVVRSGTSFKIAPDDSQ